MSAVTGVSDAGLMIIGLPQASAGAVFQLVISSGKFHGTISAQTPTGSRSTTSSPGSGTGTTSPKCLFAAPAKYSNVPAAASTSQRASPIGLPALRASATGERLGPLAQQRGDAQEDAAALGRRRALTTRRTRTPRARCRPRRRRRRLRPAPPAELAAGARLANAEVGAVECGSRPSTDEQILNHGVTVVPATPPRFQPVRCGSVGGCPRRAVRAFFAAGVPRSRRVLRERSGTAMPHRVASDSDRAASPALAGQCDEGECATLRVPLDPAAPDGKQISLALGAGPGRGARPADRFAAHQSGRSRCAGHGLRASRSPSGLPEVDHRPLRHRRLGSPRDRSERSGRLRHQLDYLFDVDTAPDDPAEGAADAAARSGSRGVRAGAVTCSATSPRSTRCTTWTGSARRSARTSSRTGVLVRHVPGCALRPAVPGPGPGAAPRRRRRPRRAGRRGVDPAGARGSSTRSTRSSTTAPAPELCVPQRREAPSRVGRAARPHRKGADRG